MQERRSQDTFKHLRWRFLQQQLTAFRSLTISARLPILDAWGGTNYTSVQSKFGFKRPNWNYIKLEK